MIPIPFLGRALAVCLVLALLTTAYFGWQSQQRKIGYEEAVAVYEQALTQQRAQAAETLAVETEKVRTIQKLLQDFKDKQEVKDAQNVKVVSDLRAKLLALGRLRDPGKTPGPGSGSGSSEGGDPASPGNRPNDATETSGVLSAELTEFLLAQAVSADEINAAYISCRADALNIRASQLPVGPSP